VNIIGRNLASIVFDADIRSEDVLISRDGTDLLVTLVDATAEARVVGWYDDPGAMPSTSLVFAHDAEINADTLSGLGLQLAGTHSDDVLLGLDGFDDRLQGGKGDDQLDGGLGKDVYIFLRGDGMDSIADSPLGTEDASIVLLPDIFSWEASFALGSLVVELGGGDALHFAGFDAADPYSTPVFDRLQFADGASITYDDVLAAGFHLHGSAEDDWLTGTGLDDSIDGGSGNDTLEGLNGADFLEGAGGDDNLAGGGGDYDFMSGSGGSDTYIYAAGDGTDALMDWSESEGEVDTVRLVGIEPGLAAVTQDPWIYYLVLGNGDQLALDSMPVDPRALIERIEFDDGTVWSPEDLVARIKLLAPTGGDDNLWGTHLSEALYGLEGSDSLYGNGGNDVLDGGLGEDFYYFGRGHGNDVVADSGRDGLPSNLHFGHAVSADFSLRRSADDLVLRHGSDTVTLPGWYADTDLIYAVSFELEAEYWDDETLRQMAPQRDRADLEVAHPIADQAAAEDRGFSFTVAADTFSVADDAEPLAYRATLDNGAALPEWLSFDADTRTFSGVPSQTDVGPVSIVVTAEDAEGLTASTAFTITVANTNDPPALSAEIPDNVAVEDQLFSFTPPEATFTDEDEELLEWFASRPDGSALPQWLSFDAVSRDFAGTPANEDVGSLQVRVTAIDPAGAAATDVFSIDIVNANDAPRLVHPVSERQFEAGSRFQFAVPTGTFADDDVGDNLALSALLYGGHSLPSWLKFDGVAGVFDGSPEKSENGIWRVAVTATDDAGETVTTDFNLIIHARPGAVVTGSKNDDALYGGSGNEVLIAKGGDDAIFGGAGIDILHGGAGRDVLQGGTGGDILHGGSGQNLLDGGAGSDLIFGGRAGGLIIGGQGNDLIHTGSGRDVILFNRGDGSDTVFSDQARDNTLSFGGGIRYSDVSLSRSGKDLVINTGGDDRVVLKGWYSGNQSISSLQFVLDGGYEEHSDLLPSGAIQSFDFLGMVGAFDRARSASPGLTSWHVTNALLEFHLSAADDSALGGDLAFWYGKKGDLSGISVSAAQQVIGASDFGSDAQSLRPFGGLQEGFAKLR
jgi:Ca2+-binding RTX toxin-like protein